MFYDDVWDRAEFKIRQERDALKAMLDTLTAEAFSSVKPWCRAEMERLQQENAAILKRLERAEKLLILWADAFEGLPENPGGLDAVYEKSEDFLYPEEQEAQREDIED